MLLQQIDLCKESVQTVESSDISEVPAEFPYRMMPRMGLSLDSNREPLRWQFSVIQGLQAAF